MASGGDALFPGPLSEESSAREEGAFLSQEEQPEPVTVSGGNSLEEIAGSLFESEDYAVVVPSVSGSDFYTGGTAGENLAAYPSEQTEVFTLILASELRQEKQNEASISILLIILIVGMLNYVYKFFKMFF